MPATHGEKWWKMHFLLVVFHVFGDAITPTPNGTTTWDVAAERAETRQVVDPRGWPPDTTGHRLVEGSGLFTIKIRKLSSCLPK